MSPKIGILGGIGPESTGEFYLKLINRMQERGMIKSNADYPNILINSIPAPELIYEEISDDDLVMYIDGLKQLESLDVEFILMVCNTIHLYYERLQKQIATPIIDIREEIKTKLAQDNKKNVLILGTPNTIKQGLYKFEGISTLVPNDEELNQLTDSIFKFNKGFAKEDQKSRVKKICKKYIELGAESVILGCTEFSLMLHDANFPRINTIDIMVDAVINRISKTLNNPQNR